MSFILHRSKATSLHLKKNLGILDKPLSTAVANAIQSARNITDLYSHQAAAINAIDKSSNVIVSTRTASGKSIIYQVPFIVCHSSYRLDSLRTQVPFLRYLENDSESTAMFIYPTKVHVVMILPSDFID